VSVPIVNMPATQSMEELECLHLLMVTFVVPLGEGCGMVL